MKHPTVGDCVIYHDERGIGHSALLKAVFDGGNEEDYTPCVNLVFVSGDTARKDGAGRQTEVRTSVVHATNSGVHGQYWRWEDEDENEYVQPSI